MKTVSQIAVLFAFTFTAVATHGACAGESAVPAATTAPAASTSPATAKPKALTVAANETAIYVTKMHCAGCAKKIAGRLFKIKGVMKVRTDVEANLAVVTPQAKKQVDVKAAWAAVQAAGFTPVKVVGPQGTFVADDKTKGPKQVAQAPKPSRG